MLKCKECSQEMKRISNTHLLRCCGLTMQEYSLKHNIPIEELVLQGVLQKMRETCKNTSVEEKEKRCERRRKKHTEESKLELTKEEEQIILGSLLGDGYIHAGSSLPYSSYLILEHGIKQLDYLLYKGIKLKKLNVKFYQYYVWNSVKGRFDTINQVRTPSNPYFGELVKYFYDKGKPKYKIIYDYVKHLNSLGLAIWFMDDGSTNSNIVYLSTQRYNYESHLILQKILLENFKLQARINTIQENEFSISFDKENSDKFKEIVKPHIPSSMLYKIKEPVSSYLFINKKVDFDSAHFLSDYKGKCSNLHGGRYSLIVTIRGHINPETGMVMDYTYLKKVLKTHILDRLDHFLVNNQFPQLRWRSTTELMCIVFWFTLLHMLPGLYKLQLHETPDSWCEYIGPSWMELKKDKTHPDLLLFNSLGCFEDKSKRTRIIGKIEEIFDEYLFEDTTFDKVIVSSRAELI